MNLSPTIKIRDLRLNHVSGMTLLLRPFKYFSKFVWLICDRYITYFGHHCRIMVSMNIFRQYTCMVAVYGVSTIGVAASSLAFEIFLPISKKKEDLGYELILVVQYQKKCVDIRIINVSRTRKSWLRVDLYVYTYYIFDMYSVDRYALLEYRLISVWSW